MANWNNMTLEDMYALSGAKKRYHENPNNQQEQALATAEAQGIRDRYGISRENDISLGELNTYIAAAEKQKARDTQKQGLLTKITNSGVSDGVRTAADAVKNFQYNPNKDEQYKSYVDMYTRQGQSAAKQTMNNINSANMGRNSSYGAAATAQVQQAYAQKASEMIPVLAEQAYNKLLQQYNIEREMDSTEYDRANTAYKALLDTETTDAYLKNMDVSTRKAEHDLDIAERYDEAERKANLESANLANEISKINLEYLPKQLAQELRIGELTIADLEAALPYLDDKHKAEVESLVSQAKIYANEAEWAPKISQANYNLLNAQAVRQLSGGGSGGGGGSPYNKTNVKNFVSDVNKALKSQGYYDRAGTSGDVIVKVGDNYRWGNDIGGTASWEGPVIDYIFNSGMSAAEKGKIVSDLGLNEERTYTKYKQDKNGKYVLDANGNKIKEGTYTSTPIDKHMYTISY